MLVEYLHVNKINRGVVPQLHLIFENNIVNPLRGLIHVMLVFYNNTTSTRLIKNNDDNLGCRSEPRRISRVRNLKGGILAQKGLNLRVLSVTLSKAR